MSKRTSTPVAPPWTCPQCARVVPGREPLCHCGVSRSQARGEEQGAHAPVSGEGTSLGRVVLMVVLVAACGFAFYTAVKQRDEGLRTGANTGRGQSGYPALPSVPAENVPPAESAARASTPRIPDSFPGQAPYTPPSGPIGSVAPPARVDATPATTKATPTPAADDASPAPTAMEEAWAKASALIAPRLQDIAANTGELQQRYQPFARACLASPEGNWLVSMRSGAFAPSGVPLADNFVTFNCPAARTLLVARADELKSQLNAVETLARTSGVLPGHLRKLMATHGLEVWDQY